MEKNTHRSILFEEFDDSKSDICSILSTYDDPAGESAYRDVLEKQVVHSFDEFLEKFAPKIYETVSTDGAKPYFTYSTTYTPGAVEVDIAYQSYYRMLLSLYRSKEKCNASEVEFNYEEFFDQLKPKQAVEDAMSLRKRLGGARNRYYECLEKGESTDEAQRKFKGCVRQVRDQYVKSPLNLLPLAMADLDKKIDLAQKSLPTIEGNDGTQSALPPAGYQLCFRSDGALELEEVVSADVVVESPQERLPGVVRKELSDVIASDYDRRVSSQNEFVRALIVSTYAPLNQSGGAGALLPPMELGEMKARRAAYEKIYQDAKANFIQTMTETVEKLLGVQAFFDHATVNGELSDGLIVTNCSVDRLMKEFRDGFRKFLLRVGHDTVNKRVWFAIVPRVSEAAGAISQEDEEEDLLADDYFDGAFDKASTPRPITSAPVSMNALRQLLGMMDEARIMTIFSFQANQENNFLMTPKYVEEKRKTLGDLKNKHAVYAYPNFTLTRPRNIKLFEHDEAERLAIPGVYIDAAYVAGGLLVGSQQHSYLLARKFSVHRELPCVRIDLEKVNDKLVTKFNREAYFGFNEALRSAINEDRMGFVFSGDAMGDVQNTYVYTANTFYKSPNSDRYRPIYVTLVEDYIRAVYNTMRDKTRRGIEQDFIKGHVAQWKRATESKEHKNDVNVLLYENETIALEDNPETGKPELKISLSALDAVLDNLEINVEQKA